MYLILKLASVKHRQTCHRVHFHKHKTQIHLAGIMSQKGIFLITTHCPTVRSDVYIIERRVLQTN